MAEIALIISLISLLLSAIAKLQTHRHFQIHREDSRIDKLNKKINGLLQLASRDLDQITIYRGNRPNGETIGGEIAVFEYQKLFEKELCLHLRKGTKSWVEYINFYFENGLGNEFNNRFIPIKQGLELIYQSKIEPDEKANNYELFFGTLSPNQLYFFLFFCTKKGNDISAEIVLHENKVEFLDDAFWENRFKIDLKLRLLQNLRNTIGNHQPSNQPQNIK